MKIYAVLTARHFCLYYLKTKMYIFYEQHKKRVANNTIYKYNLLNWAIMICFIKRKADE